MYIKEKLALYKKGFYQANNYENPTDVDLTDSDEADLNQLGSNDVGHDLSAKIILEGARSAFPRLMGMIPHWGCKEFRVYRTETKLVDVVVTEDAMPLVPAAGLLAFAEDFQAAIASAPVYWLGSTAHVTMKIRDRVFDTEVGAEARVSHAHAFPPATGEKFGPNSDRGAREAAAEALYAKAWSALRSVYSKMH